MRQWHRKAITDGLKSIVPFQNALRQLKRRISPYKPRPEVDDHLVGDACRILKHLRETGGEIQGRDVVEIGTGWLPVISLMLSASGAKSVRTIDMERLLDTRLIAYAARAIRERESRMPGWGAAVNIPSIRTHDADVIDVLRPHGIEYSAPANFCHLKDESADVIVSRDVFEHIPESTLDDIIRGAFRILRPGGYMCHIIDMSDHWAHADRSISPVNFLQFDGGMWHLAGANPQNFQNRLRRFEYVRMFERNGFRILRATGEPDPRCLTALRELPLCKRYRDVDHAELAIIATIIVATKPARTAPMH
jgi:SAM-dependent methyltransferase